MSEYLFGLIVLNLSQSKQIVLQNTHEHDVDDYSHAEREVKAYHSLLVIILVLVHVIPEALGSFVEHKVDDAEVAPDLEDHAKQTKLVPHNRSIQRKQEEYKVC